VVVAEAKKPRLSLAVGLDVRPGDPFTLSLEDAREPCPLQQRHLAGGVARRDGADLPGLDDGHAATGPDQQEGSDQARDPGPDDDVVVPVLQHQVGLDRGAVPPQRGERVVGGVPGRHGGSYPRSPGARLVAPDRPRLGESLDRGRVRADVIEVERTVQAPPESVWNVLSDGWLYPLWVVGASRIRQVDDAWPEPGSRIHHSVGLWPAVLDDDTEVLECVPVSRIGLRAKAWPSGQATVTLRLEPQGASTRVRMAEDVTAGPARLVPKPVRAPALLWRNRESLRRLAWLAERRG
jgi:uncharacterized protein YndB with AHSA1/START domain